MVGGGFKATDAAGGCDRAVAVDPRSAEDDYAAAAAARKQRRGASDRYEMLRDPQTKPEGYHDEFARETKGVAYDARTAAVDAQMYAHDPEYAKAAAEAREANKAAKEALAKEAGKA